MHLVVDQNGDFREETFMRAMAFKASERSTAFRRARECELRGVSLSCSGDHETVTCVAPLAFVDSDNLSVAVALCFGAPRYLHDDAMWA